VFAQTITVGVCRIASHSVLPYAPDAAAHEHTPHTIGN
jgi:hypothetical protein